jgi:phosphomannomutase
MNIMAMREKDAFQFGLMTLSLGAFLFNTNQSFADYYCSLIDKYNIQNRYFKRYDRRLYDERLSGPERVIAKAEGEAKRNRIMQFFHDLAVKKSSVRNIEEIGKEIQSRLPKGGYTLPSILNISLIGSGGLLDGTFIQFETLWFVIRASGTDAVLRYYLNGKNDHETELFQKAIMNIEI